MTSEALLAEMRGAETLPYFDMRAAELGNLPGDFAEERHKAAKRYVQNLRDDIRTALTEGYKEMREKELEAILQEYPDLREWERLCASMSRS